MALQLLIGNKNYSSWSMRPWVLMTELGIPFEERRVRLDVSDGSPFRQEVARVSPAGLVPVLVDSDDGFAVWDTLAITERLHECFPDRRVWPADARARARARSLSAEMHSGFGALRSHCPMNIEVHLPEVAARIWAEQPGVRANVARIESMWCDALATSGGPFLFGAFSAADAFFAPVCMRLASYPLPTSATTQAYVERVRATHSVRHWVAEALQEHDYLAEDEPYRSHR